jgi:hypothetical protein
VFTGRLRKGDGAKRTRHRWLAQKERSRKHAYVRSGVGCMPREGAERVASLEKERNKYGKCAQSE